jgi:hypothetical protein
MYYPETSYARSKDGNVAYQIVGEGPQDLVFIPSWLNNINATYTSERGCSERRERAKSSSRAR